ncbi:MAG: imidazole glycerol phosphate synthase subunit HisH [Thermodesulfobacteriota bacterium]
MIVIVDYHMGNLGSILNMLKKIGAPAVISSRTDDLAAAEKLILPGVGSFDAGMKNIADLGLRPVLERKVIEEKTPVLGICLGMQLLARRSEEGERPGLGWIEAEAVRFRFPGNNGKLKVPHMGWNFLEVHRPHPLLEGLTGSRFYFVHSYHVVCRDQGDVLATAGHGLDVTAVLARGHVMGTQFHPEKSHKYGLRLLGNFARLQ